MARNKPFVEPISLAEPSPLDLKQSRDLEQVGEGASAAAPASCAVACATVDANTSVSMWKGMQACRQRYSRVHCTLRLRFALHPFGRRRSTHCFGRCHVLLRRFMRL